jgi:heterodisulfide reductase subunit A-like polyferredoxin
VPITLVDTAADLNRKLSAEAYRLESGVPLNFAHRPGLIRILRNGNIRCAMPAVLRSVKHSPQGFRARIELDPTYVDAQRCTLCGQCVGACPLSGDRDRRPLQGNDRMALPGRVVIDKRRTPLCEANCPLGVQVQGYLALAGAGGGGGAGGGVGGGARGAGRGGGGGGPPPPPARPPGAD